MQTAPEALTSASQATNQPSGSTPQESTVTNVAVTTPGAAPQSASSQVRQGIETSNFHYAQARLEGSYAYDTDPGLASFLQRCQAEARPPRQDTEPAGAAEASVKSGRTRILVCLDVDQARGTEAPEHVRHIKDLFHEGDVIWVYIAYLVMEVPTDEIDYRNRAEQYAGLVGRHLSTPVGRGPAIYVYVDRTRDIYDSSVRFGVTHRINFVAVPSCFPQREGYMGWLLSMTSRGAGLLKHYTGSISTNMLAEMQQHTAVLMVHTPRPQQRLCRYLLCVHDTVAVRGAIPWIARLLRSKDLLVIYCPYLFDEDDDDPRDPTTTPEAYWHFAFSQRLKAQILDRCKTSTVAGFNEEQIQLCVEPQNDPAKGALDAAKSFACDTVIISCRTPPTPQSGEVASSVVFGALDFAVLVVR